MKLPQTRVKIDASQARAHITHTHTYRCKPGQGTSLITTRRKKRRKFLRKTYSNESRKTREETNGNKEGISTAR